MLAGGCEAARALKPWSDPETIRGAAERRIGEWVSRFENVQKMWVSVSRLARHTANTADLTVNSPQPSETISREDDRLLSFENFLIRAVGRIFCVPLDALLAVRCYRIVCAPKWFARFPNFFGLITWNLIVCGKACFVTVSLLSDRAKRLYSAKAPYLLAVVAQTSARILGVCRWIMLKDLTWSCHLLDHLA